MPWKIVKKFDVCGIWITWLWVTRVFLSHYLHQVQYFSNPVIALHNNLIELLYQVSSIFTEKCAALALHLTASCTTNRLSSHSRTFSAHSALSRTGFALFVGYLALPEASLSSKFASPQSRNRIFAINILEILRFCLHPLTIKLHFISNGKAFYRLTTNLQ